MGAANRLALTALLGLSGCAQGWNAGADDARSWFGRAAPDLRRIVLLVERCLPRRASGYSVLWASDGDNPDEPVHCTRGPDSQLRAIQAAMREARVIGVNYARAETAGPAIASVSLILFREGMVTAGSMTSIAFYVTPHPCRGTVEIGNRSRFERRALTSGPCRWFWEHDVT